MIYKYKKYSISCLNPKNFMIPIGPKNKNTRISIQSHVTRKITVGDFNTSNQATYAKAVTRSDRSFNLHGYIGTLIGVIVKKRR